MTTFYISGHLDVSDTEFETHYIPSIAKGILSDALFVVGDARGADAKAQAYLKERGYEQVVVYHMFDKPRNNAGFPTKGGFVSDDTRDVAMTDASDADIAWVRPGREKSGTAKNLTRRAKRS